LSQPLRIIRSTRDFWLAYFNGRSMMAVAGRTCQPLGLNPVLKTVLPLLPTTMFELVEA
jgi:hypothetical protein